MSNQELDSMSDPNLKRILYSQNNIKKGVTLICFSGIHGNEPAGIHAINKVTNTITNNNIVFNGNFYALAGNLNALMKKMRFIETDLNRIWTKEHLLHVNNNNQNLIAEDKEQFELFQIIKQIVSQHEGTFYFIDLHTTSSETKPFITISDSINNRTFTKNFSIPVILGIEEFLEGTLLTYINEFGYISLGFEAGQHTNPKSVDNCEAFIWLALASAGCIIKSEIESYKNYESILSEENTNHKFYEIKEYYKIKKEEIFKMYKGFENFDPILKDQPLASNNGTEIRAQIRGYIFMPLYQKQGEDGFFIIRETSKFWLFLSIQLRTFKLHSFLRLLPGVKQSKDSTYTLIVNPKVAKFFMLKVFHLFGYRKKIVHKNKLYVIRRDREIIPFD